MRVAISRQRIRDFTLYIVIAVSFVSTLLWTADHTRNSGAEIMTWFGLGIDTLIVFGYSIQRHRREWKIRAFRLTLSRLLVLPFIVLLSVLQRVGEFRAPWWAVVIVLEQIAVDAWLTFIRPRARQPRPL